MTCKTALLCLFLLGVMSGLYSCYEPKEGCTDIAATNLDVTADKNCEKCCTYPELRLFIRQKYDTLTFVENKIYEGISGQYFRLKSVSFYLSDFEIAQNQQALTVTDTLTFKKFGNAATDTVKQSLTNDFVLVRRASDNIKVGSFRNFGTFDRIRFILGINDSESRIISPTTPAGHPLQKQQDSLWHGYDAGYVFLQAVVARDTAASSTSFDTISLKRADMMPLTLETNSGFSVNHRSGFNYLIRLELDYKKMLKGIDWIADNKAAWKAKIMANLPASFTFLN